MTFFFRISLLQSPLTLDQKFLRVVSHPASADQGNPHCLEPILNPFCNTAKLDCVSNGPPLLHEDDGHPDDNDDENDDAERAADQQTQVQRTLQHCNNKARLALKLSLRRQGRQESCVEDVPFCGLIFRLG